MSVRIYEVLEILDHRQQRTSRYRLATYTNSEEPTSLCKHMHNTPEEALECPTAKEIIDREFSPRFT